MKRILKVIVATLAILAGTTILCVGGFIAWYQISFYTGTIYAKQFTSRKWKTVSVGMSKEQVYKIIGPPLDYAVDWNRDKGEEDVERLLWTRTEAGFGFVHALFFRNGVVVKKIEFRDD